MREVWVQGWRSVTVSWADTRVTVMGRIGWRSDGEGSEGGVGVVAERVWGRDLDSIYGFHRCCVCQSLTAAIMSKDCFHKLNLHRRCD